MNTKIIVATHKAYWMPEDDIYLPVHVKRHALYQVRNLKKSCHAAIFYYQNRAITGLKPITASTRMHITRLISTLHERS